MPQHDVDVTMPRRELGPTDVIFDVKVDGSTLGALHISKGAVVWFPRGNSYGNKLDWTSFDRVMQDNGARNERR